MGRFWPIEGMKIRAVDPKWNLGYSSRCPSLGDETAVRLPSTRSSRCVCEELARAAAICSLFKTSYIKTLTAVALASDHLHFISP